MRIRITGVLCSAAILLFLVTAFTALAGCSSPSRESVPVNYFFASHCNDCEETGERLKVLKTKFTLQDRRIQLDVKLSNVLTDSGWEALEEMLGKTEIPLSAQNMPLLFVGDLWFYGEDEIDEAVSMLENRRLPPELSR